MKIRYVLGYILGSALVGAFIILIVNYIFGL